MVDNQGILNRIIKLMEEKNISQKELCAAIGLKSQQAFTNWKNGNNNSFMKHLPQISTVLGTTTDFLLGRTSEKTVPDEKLEGVDFALSGEIRHLSNNEKQDLLDYILFKKAQKENRQG